ncbi:MULTISPECIES: IPT/TIG domain-containing protein [Deinococcus]|uniref:IPT/TIG domain-containing protein n=1 Tax=Deinococcus rufus TaxID=2136097 RepID=A0ABV7ZE54_9DEIO|nr:IPT/TIG domain-containing protein [Deinococcus sp. AB2017081]WQE93962.1 IPT/TIG domain-containing protein [Deinococcus sp. AB2017081]
MLRFFVAPLLFAGVLASCAPRQQIQTAEQMVTVTPMLVKVSEAAPRGGQVVIQGRYLGGPNIGKVRLGADERGTGGYVFPANAVVSWTDSQIVLTIPADAPIGGSWLFVEVGAKRSTGLPYSVRQ